MLGTNIGIAGVAGIQRITTDTKGFRVTKNIDYESKSAFRIFAIGGSTTEQIFLDDKTTWTHLLQEKFSEHFPVEVINTGVSAETLKVVMRHRDFATTEKFYGATRAAQSAAAEIYDKLGSECSKAGLGGGLVGGQEAITQLSAEQVEKLKALLEAL